MKYSLFALAVCLTIIALPPAALAATATPSATPTSTKTRQIEDLKERLATRVAELRQTQKRAMVGIIKTVSVSTVTIETKTKDIKIELSDDIKVYQNLKGTRTKLTINDLEKDDPVIVFGDYDSTLDILTAKVIFISAAKQVRIAGTVSAIDKNDFTLSVNTHEGPTYTVDIERTTKTNAWTKGTGLEKSGFSKINVGDIVHIVGSPVANRDNRISAGRILSLAIMNDSATTTPTATTTPAATPKAAASPTGTVTGTPRSTPSPTVKATGTPRATATPTP